MERLTPLRTLLLALAVAVPAATTLPVASAECQGLTMCDSPLGPEPEPLCIENGSAEPGRCPPPEPDPEPEPDP